MAITELAYIISAALRNALSRKFVGGYNPLTDARFDLVTGGSTVSDANAFFGGVTPSAVC